MFLSIFSETYSPFQASKRYPIQIGGLMVQRLVLPLVFILTFVLAACALVPSDQAAVSTTPPGVVLPSVVVTAISGSVSVGTVEPVIVTSPPLDYTPPPTAIPPTITPIPAIPGGLRPTELKYHILAQFPDLFFCDPDQFPVAHEDIYKLAKQRFAEVQANQEEFNSILTHLNLSSVTDFSDDQMLQIYQEHKKLAAIKLTLDQAGYQFQLQSAKGEGEGVLIRGLIDPQGLITVEEKTPVIATCPICLAEGTLIDTPSGPVPVERVYPGLQVWTQDRHGLRVAATVLKAGYTLVPSGHQVVHLVLQDGRQVWASPGHPTVQGTELGNLRLGDLLDGSPVASIERLNYSGRATFDLLPAGDAGNYWANGILVASTLHR
jgi:hypothetical protein